MGFFKKFINSISNKKEISPITELTTSSSTNNIDISKVEVEKSNVINDFNLDPVEILLLDYVDGIITNTVSFPGYWKYQYNVDPLILIKNMISLGMLEIDSTISTGLTNSSMNDLKRLLKDNGLKVSGNKKDLVNRLIENVAHEELQKSITNKHYKLTDKGREILKNNQHIKFFHQNSNFGISIYQAHDMKNKNINYSHHDIAWHLLSISSREHATKGNWGLYRNDRLSMAGVSNLENNFKTCLDLLFEVCFIDLSGIGNNFNLNYMDIYDEHFFPYEKSLHTLAPGVIKSLIEIKVKLKFTDEDLRKSFMEFIESYQLPFHLFTKVEVLEIIIYEINNDKGNVSKIYKIAEDRYFKNKYEVHS